MTLRRPTDTTAKNSEKMGSNSFGAVIAMFAGGEAGLIGISFRTEAKGELPSWHHFITSSTEDACFDRQHAI